MTRRRAGITAVVTLVAGWLALRAWPLPAGLLATRAGVEVQDRDGDVLLARPGPDGLRSREVRVVPPDMERMVLAAEDHRFRMHPGVDPIGVGRAALRNLQAGRVREGGSTITQQLARALAPRRPGLFGKLGEAVLALRIEGHLDKDAVLAAYLSRVWYGNGAVGAEEAARVYFDRPLAALSLAQAATLAAIPRRPADLDPYVAPRRVVAARDGVLARARALGWIDSERESLARAEPLTLRVGVLPGEAPHFVRRVVEGADAGGVVQSTLDRDLQSAAERIVREELERLSERGVGQAAVVVLDTATRDVLAYVGSAAWRARDGQVDGVRALRSPGSALKPFLYALALEDGTSSLADVIPDLPGTWRTPHGNWRPHNYDRVAGGPVCMRAALAQSLNLPAVRIADRVGVGVLLERLRALGLDTLEADAARYGLALVVGSGEVRLDALTAAYAAISDGGRHAPPRLRMDAPAAKPRPVMSALSAFLVFDALDDDDARAPAFGRESALEPEYPFATKTGTSTGWRDNWAFGTNEAVTVGVWVGNFDGSAMGQVGGTTGAAPILRRVADRAMEGRTARAPRPPAGDDAVVPVVSVRACPLSGADAGPWCGASVAEWVPRGASRAPCAWHGPRGATVPATYAAWAAANGVAVDAESAGVAPRVQYPVSGATFWIEADRPREEQAIPLRAAAAGVSGRWEVDGVTVATVGSPFTARWVPSPGEHRIVLVVDGVASAPARVRVEAASP